MCIRCLLFDASTVFPFSFTSSFNASNPSQVIPQLNSGCCSLCGRHQGFLLLTQNHHLLHKRCLQSIPGAHLKEPVHDGISTHIGAYLPPSFLPTPTGALCRVCKSGYGSLVKCHHKSCNNHFHLSCLNPSCHFFTPTSEGVAPTFPVHV